MSGVNAREQRAAKPPDARNEGTRVVICVSRAPCSIEPSACHLLKWGKNWRAKRTGESLGREFFFYRFTPLFAFSQLRRLVPRLMLI